MPAETREVVEAERNFAKMCRETTQQNAFLSHMDDESLLFFAAPVKGRPIVEKEKAQPGLLQWGPMWADASVSGDLGYTTGPWTFQAKPEDQPKPGGYYFTIWKRTDKGWKFVLDAGIG